ncbi:MAG: hypothetical protein SGJ21_11715 [Alphaproteobacteria bacterium]|nr:hypothetical protein [Alphaproteobacteria bacterium]
MVDEARVERYGLYAATPPPDPYEHELFSWSAIIAGTLIAIALGFTLNVLGAAIGASTMSPFQTLEDQAPEWSIAGGLWVVFSNLVAIQVGAFVAARAARHPDHHHGVLQGLAVWALSFVVAFAVIGAGLSGLLNDVGGANAVEGAVNAAQAATGEATGAPRELTPAEVDAAQDAAALTAWWAFAMMVLGAVGGMAGGYLGSKHPNWHRRSVTLAHAARPVTLADKV